MRHVSRTHRVALDWLFDRIILGTKIQIKNVDSKTQLAAMLTKGNFTRDEWNHLLRLFNIMNLSMCSCSHFSPIKKHQNLGEEVDAGKKTRRRTCGGEFESNEFGIKERESIPDAGFGYSMQPGELWNAKLEFTSFKHREIDSARCERKRNIKFSSVASKMRTLVQAPRNRWRKQINAQASRNRWRKYKIDSQTQGPQFGDQQTIP